jgi:hypothetical protein
MHAECHIILKREALFFVGKECLGSRRASTLINGISLCDIAGCHIN